MSHCSIYFPGLLGPDRPVEALDKNEWPGIQQSPCLTKLLNRGQYTQLTKTNIESRILTGMGVAFEEPGDAPIARLRARQVPQLKNHNIVWCLDPVFIQIDKEDAVLHAHEELNLTENEAQIIIDDLNTHFVEDGFKLHFHSEHSWILEAELELTTSSLSSALQKNISQHQPVGVSEKRWRTLLNEIQMLLYNHPINEARESRGDIPVNSLWLWGGGRTDQYNQVIDSVYCNEGWVNDVAQAYDISSRSIDEIIRLKELSSFSLLVYTDQLDAIRQNDAFVWLDSLKMFEKKMLSVAMKMLENGKLKTLTIYSDTVSISAQRKDLKKWWKRIRPVRDVIINSRKDYGY